MLRYYLSNYCKHLSPSNSKQWNLIYKLLFPGDSVSVTKPHNQVLPNWLHLKFYLLLVKFIIIANLPFFFKKETFTILCKIFSSKSHWRFIDQEIKFEGTTMKYNLNNYFLSVSSSRNNCLKTPLYTFILNSFLPPCYLNTYYSTLV